MAERTLRKPKRPLAYGVLMLAAALVLAASTAAALKLSTVAQPAPAEVARY